MSQIAMFGISIALGLVFGVLLKYLVLLFTKVSRLAIVVIDFFSFGFCLSIAGILMQFYNQKVSFYLYFGLAFGFVLIQILLDNYKQTKYIQTKKEYKQ